MRLEPGPNSPKGSMEAAMQSPTYYEDKYCPPDEAEEEETEICDLPDADNFMVPPPPPPPPLPPSFPRFRI